MNVSKSGRKYFFISSSTVKNNRVVVTAKYKNNTMCKYTVYIYITHTQNALFYLFFVVFFHSQFFLYLLLAPGGGLPLCPEILQYTVHSDSACPQSFPLWEMPDSNPGQLPQKSGALPMSHHIPKMSHHIPKWATTSPHEPPHPRISKFYFIKGNQNNWSSEGNICSADSVE